ncbi:hypothetical protein [Neobacillus sp. SAB-20_R2A]|uniref:magnesium chelatase subunit ChlI family protein n=1 Tax=Neobacillus sp. SAB-20_R2A TaxID=3120519 RepID=UPI003C6E1BE4
MTNSLQPYESLMKTSPLTEGQQRTLNDLLNKKGLSKRAQIKIIRLARTISDLERSPCITDQSIAEAIRLNSGTLKR